MNVHFSVDDVLKSFGYLERINAVSIYESFVFSTLRDIHVRYNIPIDVYCMYKSGDCILSNISDRWKRELYETRDWLRFGFHAYSDDSNYNYVTEKEFEKQYTDFSREIKRITGQEELSEIIRLHYFSGNKER